MSLPGCNRRLGYGTDLVAVNNNYENGREFTTWMRSGVNPFKALWAATKNNAEICGIDDITGARQPGKYADISGWGRNILKDEDALRDCAFVMKEGTIYKAESYINL